jgi:hypothetical protein
MKLFLTRLCDKQAIKIYISALVLQIANMIRFMIDSYSKPLPAILEIPSKDHPYDPNQDSILSRVKHMFSSDPSGPGDRKWFFCFRIYAYSVGLYSTPVFFPVGRRWWFSSTTTEPYIGKVLVPSSLLLSSAGTLAHSTHVLCFCAPFHGENLYHNSGTRESYPYQFLLQVRILAATNILRRWVDFRTKGGINHYASVEGVIEENHHGVFLHVFYLSFAPCWIEFVLNASSCHHYL